MGEKQDEERVRQKTVSFPCGNLTLEGLCYYPENDGTFPAVVLCHPHPLYGGSMNNNVIRSLGSTLISKSIIAFMFNFRGTGESEGTFGGGIAEQKDVSAAISWLSSQPEVDAGRIGLAGYSFGAIVASPVACDDKRVKAMALISPPLEASQTSCLKDCTMPKLIISGTEDFFVSSQKAEMIHHEAADPKQLELISGADHFWYGYETAMSEVAAAFFSNSFGQA